MKLDTERYEEYWHRGWTVVEGVFDAGRAEATAQTALEVWQDADRKDDSGYLAQPLEDGSVVPRKISSPFLQHPDLRRFVLDPRLRGLIEQLISREPLLFSDQIFMKPPRHGGPKPYHQDNGYFLAHPDDHVITAWVALDDVDEHNGCLRYIDGSNQGPILEHIERPDEPFNRTPPAELIDLSRESLAPVGKGGVVFHHSRTLHTSHRNHSDRWRRGYATHWVSAEVTSESGNVENGYEKTHADLYREALAAVGA